MNKKSILAGTLVALLGTSSYVGTPAFAQENQPETGKATVEQRYDTPETNPLFRGLLRCLEGRRAPRLPHAMEPELNQYMKTMGLELKLNEARKYNDKVMTSKDAMQLIAAGVVPLVLRNIALDSVSYLKKNGQPYDNEIKTAAKREHDLQIINYILQHSKIVTDR